MDVMQEGAAIDEATGLHVSTADCECLRCRTDLFTASIISPQASRLLQ